MQSSFLGPMLVLGTSCTWEGRAKNGPLNHIGYISRPSAHRYFLCRIVWEAYLGVHSSAVSHPNKLYVKSTMYNVFVCLL